MILRSQIATREVPRVFKDLWYWLVPLHFFVFVVTEWVMIQSDMSIMTPGQSSIYSPIAWKAAGGLIEVAVNIVTFLLVCGVWQAYWKQTVRPSLKQLLKVHGWFVVLEGLRSVARIALWSLMILLPGLYKWAKLFLVPYIVVLSQPYQAGKVDALAYASQMAQKGGRVYYLSLAIFMPLSILLPPLLYFGPLKESALIWRFLFSMSFIFWHLFVQIFYCRFTIDLEKELLQ